MDSSAEWSGGCPPPPSAVSLPQTVCRDAVAARPGPRSCRADAVPPSLMYTSVCFRTVRGLQGLSGSWTTCSCKSRHCRSEVVFRRAVYARSTFLDWRVAFSGCSGSEASRREDQLRRELQEAQAARKMAEGNVNKWASAKGLAFPALNFASPRLESNRNEPPVSPSSRLEKLMNMMRKKMNGVTVSAEREDERGDRDVDQARLESGSSPGRGGVTSPLASPVSPGSATATTTPSTTALTTAPSSLESLTSACSSNHGALDGATASSPAGAPLTGPVTELWRRPGAQCKASDVDPGQEAEAASNTPDVPSHSTIAPASTTSSSSPPTTAILVPAPAASRTFALRKLLVKAVLLVAAEIMNLWELSCLKPCP